MKSNPIEKEKKNKGIELNDVVDVMGKSFFYNKILLETMTNQTLLHKNIFGEIVGYRKVKVPKYLTIKVPVIEKDYDNDYEYGNSEFRGYLISFKKVNICRIGTKIEEEPIYKKRKLRGIISFKRYGEN